MRRRWSRVAVAFAGLAIAMTSKCECEAQEPERAPLANAFGRFWGFGWSAGYHSRAENRFGMHRYMPDHNVVPDPIRGAAASQHLGGPNTTMYPGNAPLGGYYNVPMHFAPNAAPMVHGGYSQPVYNQPAPATPSPAVKPVEPPPSWLKQYMKPEAGNQDGNDNLLNENLLNENSPSDRRGMRNQPSGISILQ